MVRHADDETQIAAYHCQCARGGVPGWVKWLFASAYGEDVTTGLNVQVENICQLFFKSCYHLQYRYVLFVSLIFKIL